MSRTIPARRWKPGAEAVAGVVIPSERRSLSRAFRGTVLYLRSFEARLYEIAAVPPAIPQISCQSAYFG